MTTLSVEDELLLDAMRRGPVTLVLTGRSMTPAIPEGARVETEPLLGREPVPGEIVIHHVAGSFVAHRLVRWEGPFAVLKGDANGAADAPVKGNRIRARVVAVTWKGRRVVQRHEDAWAWLLGAWIYRRVHQVRWALGSLA